MSLTRAFTTRRVKQSLDLRDTVEGLPQRSNTTKGNGVTSIRHKISAPVELVHTTNMLSYNAPDLYPKAPSLDSAKSDDESDTAMTSASTPPTSPDSPFPEKRSLSPELNHLSCYFAAPSQAMAATPAPEAPAIPQRAPSHTKKSYDGLVRHRSASRLSEQSSRSISTKASFTFSRSSSSSTSTSTTSGSHHSYSLSQKPSLPTILSPPVPTSSFVTHKKEYSDSHPFGQELAQVSELAEGYAIKEKTSVVDEERQEMQRLGLQKVSAEDYLRDVQELARSIFADARPIGAMWI